MRITREVLEYTGACEEERERFLRIWPDGLELTRENLARVRKRDFHIWLPGADLSEMDLSGMNLTGATLAGANLSGANVTSTDLSHADLAGAYLLETDLSRTNLYWAYLSGADLTGTILGDWELSPDGYIR
jgi:uncharacterized protein YjbI with pentapeptide repeats